METGKRMKEIKLQVQKLKIYLQIWKFEEFYFCSNTYEDFELLVSCADVTIKRIVSLIFCAANSSTIGIVMCNNQI